VDENGMKDQLIIAYESVNHTKLYFPGAEKSRKFKRRQIKIKENP